jgi:PAB1-binding protein PBP1
MSNLKHFQINSAFKQIKYYSEILTEADHTDKDQAARHIVKKIDLMITSRNWFVIGNLDRNKDGDY